MNESSDGKPITNSVVDENSSKDQPLTLSKINLLKESLQLIFTDPSISGFRVGIMDFGSGRPNLAREVLDIDEVDHSRDIKIISTNADRTTFRQIVWVPTDDGYQHINTRNPWLTNANHVVGRDNHYFAYRFDNILLKNKSISGVSAPDYGIDKAEFNIYLSGLLSGANYKNGLKIYVDPNSESQYLRQRTKNDLVDRVNAAKKAGLTATCDIITAGANYYTCNVTDLIRKQIAKNDWQDGNAITLLFESNSFYTPNNSRRDTGVAWFKEYSNGNRAAYLDITAKNNVIATNKKTRKESIIDTAFSLQTSGSTHINRALLASSQYISNIPKNGNIGPYHLDISSAFSKGKDVASTVSPLLAGCQLTHFILMSDGQPSSSYAGTVRNYMGQKGKCTIDGVVEKYGKSTEECGRSLSYWLTKTDQSINDGANFKGPNYIWTHTIGFGMGGADDDDEEGSGGGLEFDPASQPFKYLEDLAGYGNGQFHQTKDIDGLVDAFKSIINEALSVNGAAVSGQVLASSKDIFQQRREVFYSLFQSQLMDYWPGNIKGFKMVYLPKQIKGQATEIPVLYSWDETKPAIGYDGNIKNGIDSAWSKGSGDGGNVKSGGVVSQLPDPAQRNLFTIDNGSKKMINSSASLSPAQLGLANDENDVKKGLLDFMRGYTFQLNGSQVPAGKKIGDSILSGVALVSYGCNSGSDIISCPFDGLNLVGLSAANDGVFRGYDLKSGEPMYEFMPTEMLPLIKKLQKPKQINESIKDPSNPNKTIGKTVKSYGLDGKVIIYHEDTDKDNYINNNEKAYAFVASGRGGPYMYAFDISNRTAPKLLWTKTEKNLSGLGETWSEPVVGKVKFGSVITPVVIFGAGYDPGQSDKIEQHSDSKGNSVYMLNAITGDVIWTTNQNMHYSIPGGVAILNGNKENEELITDIFFGDMGGQLWRFTINNGATSAADLVKPGGGENGLVAKISGGGVNNTRRFYQKPIIYDFSADKVTDTSLNNMIAVNIGSGYKAHPLITDNEDRFYSLRFPKIASASGSKVLTESDLAVLTLNTTGSDNYIEEGDSIKDGFMVKLESKAGEKVISNAYAVTKRLVFNTYVPDNTYNPTNCIPNIGKKRSYNIDIVNGKNLLSSKYIETSVSTIPNDITIYCSGSACSIITGTDMLDGDTSKFDKGRDDCTGNECLPFNFPKGRVVRKTGWTDLFSF